VTRVAREVGTEGKLGGQAKVPGVGGTWKDLTDNVNLMATNLTNQVRGIADVVTAVAQGNLKRKLTVDAKGEIAALAETINFMIDTLSTFGDQVTSMAREVGIEGRLGGQARVPGAAGLWRDLTDNVNQLAANLTNQVRSIADVATAVTKGDLTRSIAVEASGEMAALKDNINEMIRNLKEQTLKNAEQDWLKTNLARFSRMLQGERELETVSNLIMSELAPLMNAQYGAFYVAKNEENGAVFELAASYGVADLDKIKTVFRPGEGLVGQCAVAKKSIALENAPSGFMPIQSGLGSAPPANILIMPALFENEVKAVIELATIEEFKEAHLSFIDQFLESVGVVLNTIAATMRTEGLLKQSQLLTHELQSRQTELTTKQEELHTTNDALQEKAQLLENEKKQVEAKNLEIEMARRALEEKAEQLALTSKYKSEFLANMSHELRTPLNAILGFSQLLTRSKSLSSHDMEYLDTIGRSGKHLLTLINQVLDLSTIEAGRLTLNESDFDLYGLLDEIEDMFQIRAVHEQLNLVLERDDKAPRFIRSDPVKFRQVLINLLNNAFKFTKKGAITLRVDVEENNGDPLGEEGSSLQLKFEVEDTGTGMAHWELSKIFNAFEQTESGRLAKEGTGLGLTISRRFIELMGGHTTVESELGRGALFKFDICVKTARSEAAETIAPLRKVVSLEPGQPRYRIMVVDDNPMNRLLLIRLLEIFEFDLQDAEDGQRAVDLYREWHPHLIFMDMRMPVMDGYEATKTIKSEDGERSTKVIAISASTLKREQVAMLAAGCDESISKPFREADIYEAMERHLGVRWVYEDICGSEQERTTKEPEDWQALFFTIPVPLQVKLKDALLRADMGAIDLSIVQIAEQSPRLAVKLQEWAHDFEYESILSLMKGDNEESRFI
ncbi:MAG: response regulator, partial [Oricola sp.]|nr:response regulator [Oricola sp.]